MLFGSISVLYQTLMLLTGYSLSFWLIPVISYFEFSFQLHLTCEKLPLMQAIAKTQLHTIDAVIDK
ncbi:hypothetical protein T08_7698 [Trichinella sp. T8]|nr:hypothetical protein T08_7698 [Trichinella sp. T8]